MNIRKIILSLFILISFAYAEESNWAVGPHLLISIPQSDFANLSKTGEGIGGKILYKIESVATFVKPRFDIAYISYGEKRKTTPFSVGYFIVQTRNESFQFTIGPEFHYKIGRVTPYIAPMGGLYLYRTVVSIPDLYYYYGIPASETVDKLTKLGWNINAGLLIDIGLGPHIDISVKYQTIRGAVKSEVEGHKIESDAKDINISIGVLFYLNED